MTLEVDRIYLGNCLELMREIPDESIDAIITDPPYGATQNRWDVPIPFDEMWAEFTRITKEHSVIAIFGLPPFSSQLIVSNPKMYRYTWIWDKRRPVGFLNANRAPLRRYESISIFSRKSPAYFPQMGSGTPYRNYRKTKGHNYGHYGPPTSENEGSRYPTDILSEYPNTHIPDGHPTQKPVDLMEYLILTYSLPNEVVLDPFLGSGTTALAALQTGRHYIGIELMSEYYIMATMRLEEIGSQRTIASFAEEKSS